MHCDKVVTSTRVLRDNHRVAVLCVAILWVAKDTGILSRVQIRIPADAHTRPAHTRPERRPRSVRAPRSERFAACRIGEHCRTCFVWWPILEGDVAPKMVRVDRAKIAGSKGQALPSTLAIRKRNAPRIQRRRR